MRERGIATKVDGARVTVRIEMSEGCASCNSKDGCSSAGRELAAEAAAGAAVSVGDAVYVELPDSVTATGALWLLAVPLGLAVAGYAGVGALFPGTGEGARALAALVGLAAGLIAAATVAKRGAMSRLPTATRVEA